MQYQIRVKLDDEDAAVLERAARWLWIEFPVFTEQETTEAPPLVADLARESNEAHGLSQALVLRSIWIDQKHLFMLYDRYNRLYARLLAESQPSAWDGMADSVTEQALVEAVMNSRHPAMQDVELVLDMLSRVCNTQVAERSES